MAENNPATPPATPPAAPPSNNPNDLTPAQIRERAAGAPAAQPPAQPPPAPAAAPAPAPFAPQQESDGTFSIKLPTGQVYKGATPQDAYTRLAEGQVAASQRITELTQAEQRARDAAAAALGHAPQPAQPGGPMQWDGNVYNELSKSDPGLAMDYYWGCRMGLASLDDVQPALERIQTNSIAYEQNEVVSKFRGLAPDFPGTKQAVDALMDTVSKQGVAFNAENLAMVHRDLVARRVYAPAAVPPRTIEGTPPPQVAAQFATSPGPPDPRMYDPNPVGQYAFGPNGFGSSPVMFQPAPVAPVPAPASGNYQPPPGYILVPATGAPAGTPPQMVTAPIPTSGYPAQPLATLPAGGGNGAPGGPQAVDENSVNLMDTTALRQFIEQNLTK